VTANKQPSPKGQTTKVPRDASYDDYLVTSLTDTAEAAAYLDAVMDLSDHTALLLALRQVAKAHGMARVAQR
jgi:DNA-binding phage protein